MKKLLIAAILLSSALYAENNTIYQYSIPPYLLAGQFGKVTDVAAVKKNGVDLEY